MSTWHHGITHQKRVSLILKLNFYLAETSRHCETHRYTAWAKCSVPEYLSSWYMDSNNCALKTHGIKSVQAGVCSRISPTLCCSSVTDISLCDDAVSSAGSYYVVMVKVFLKSVWVKIWSFLLPYILESNPHPNLIRTQFLAIS